MTPALILAGGRSSRMGGGDKSLTLLDGRPLLAHVLERIGPQVSALLINSNSDPALFRAFDFPVCPDTMPGRLGPLAGLLTGMRWAERISASHLLTVPCDTPFLPQNLVETLHRDLHRRQADIVIARGRQAIHPVIGLWPVHLAGQLAADLEDGVRSIRHWLRQFKVSESEFSACHFSNLNTPAELRAAEARLAA